MTWPNQQDQYKTLKTSQSTTDQVMKIEMEHEDINSNLVEHQLDRP